MFKSTQVKLILALIVFVTGGWGQEDTLEVSPDSTIRELALEVYSGVESILLVWAVPDSLAVLTTTIYRSLDPVAGYDSLIELTEPQTRYLDRSVDPETRYFYRVEVFTATGEVISSTPDTPPFTSAVSSTLAVPADSLFFISDTTLVFTELFQHYLLHNQITQCFPTKDSLVTADLFNLLSGNEIIGWEWLDIFPLECWDDFTVLAAPTLAADFLADLDTAFSGYERDLRNEQLLTPEEWRSIHSALAAPLSVRIDQLVWNYSQLKNTLAVFDPIRIVGFRSDTSGRTRVDYLVLNSAALGGKTIDLAVGENHYSLAGDSLFSGQRETIAVPHTTGWLNLAIDNEVIQTMTLDSTVAGVTCWLENNFTLDTATVTSRELIEHSTAPVLLNEIVFEPDQRRLTVEILQPADTTAVPGLLIGREEWTTAFTAGDGYLLADGAVADSLRLVWLSLGILQPDSTWLLLDSRPLELADGFHQARIPDGGEWKTTSFTTLGGANDLTRTPQQEIAIPEVFALYQNYPNPFNARTTISFDLLQPAKITLYVVDATGRKIDVFMEGIPTEPGNYKFNWDGKGRSSGVYFFTLQAQVDEYVPVTFSRKMIYLK